MSLNSAGIIAAGEGSRFKKSGITVHKPMIQVRGIPLIGHALRQFESVGIKRAVIIFNENERECVEWVQNNFSRLKLEFIVKSTQSSFESFCLVGERLGKGRHLISTVDSICAAGELKKMVSCPIDSSERIYLGITDFVDDDKPLWVEMDPSTKQITKLGVEKGNFVTAGYYHIVDSIFREKPGFEVRSLRVYLKWLAEKNWPIYGVELDQVIDVDTPHDLIIAEKLLYAQ